MYLKDIVNPVLLNPFGLCQMGIHIVIKPLHGPCYVILDLIEHWVMVLDVLYEIIFKVYV